MVVAKKVLVIDDDKDFTVSVSALLESEGYAVVVASSGQEGLRKLVEHKPDAIILDVMMETVEEGYGVNQAIKAEEEYAQYRDIPIIMVSSLEETPEERFPNAEQVGMSLPGLYLTKPLNISRFLQVLREAVGGS